MDLRETAHPHLVALRDATRETTQIAILDHWQVVYLERMLSPLPVGFMRSRAGAILPAYCTGLGKTLLAYMPEDDVAAWATDELGLGISVDSHSQVLDVAGERQPGLFAVGALTGH